MSGPADFENAALPADRRAADLLSRMTLPQKIAQMQAAWLFLDPDGDHEVRTNALTGDGAPPSWREVVRHGLGQVTRPLGTRAIDPAEGVRGLNHLQKFLLDETPHGIPALAHEECLSGLMARQGTLFPSSLAYAATWNPDLIERVGRAIGAECRSVGCRQGLAPVLDVARDARWGRTEETFGEDPYLTGILGVAYTKGLQGEDRGVLATLKHYVGHSASEGGRNHAPVHMGWRELNDDFMLPFEMAVKLADAGSVMPAYHDIDGEPVHASRHLLTNVLREEWGFDGIIVADYLGPTLLYSHHGVAAGPAEAAALSFGAGLDVELPEGDCASHLGEALDRGLLSMDDIDAIVARVLEHKFRLGLFENPYVDEGGIALNTAPSVDLAREVASQAVTVLGNDGALPLRAHERVAVIGPTANDPLALLGDYSFPVHLINNDAEDDVGRVVTPLAGLRAALGEERVSFAQGCFILETRGSGNPVFPGDMGDHASLALNSPLSTRVDLIEEAVETARRADLAIVCVGDLSGIFQTGTVGEGSDTDTLELPGVQQRLLDAILATGTPTVAVVTSGRPYNLGGREADLAALVMAWFGGEQGGAALADVLTGRREPSGRLALSIPRSAGANPYHYNHKFKSAGTPIARHFGSDYPFGHGLSYTTFAYDGLRIEEAEVASEGGTIRLSFNVRNTGERAGVEVPQLYVRDRHASFVRPVKELKAFARIELEPGEAASVDFAVPTDMLSFTGRDGRRIVEPGTFDLMIGASSGDIRLTGEAHIRGATRPLDERWRMTSEATVRARR